ncbi:hypothetical protein AAKU64_000668 [Undibacterium sp. GrIS 1.8]|uniref:hypothetical protein n=1 Tax=Undibacterium sp. GrIS 1.8 TaxID=3143934 RepID=UPI00339125DA
MSLDRTKTLIHHGIHRENPIGSLIHVLKSAIELVAIPDNDFCWSSWKDREDAESEIQNLINIIENGHLPEKVKISVLFALTGPLQEVSLSSGWAETFLKVSDKYEEVEALLW